MIACYVREITYHTAFSTVEHVILQFQVLTDNAEQIYMFVNMEILQHFAIVLQL